MNTDRAHSLNTKLALFVMALFLAGCAIPSQFIGRDETRPVAPEMPVPQAGVCDEPRPKICTLQYQPVCAVMESGRITTYPSACNACADIAVVSWRPEPCEE